MERFLFKDVLRRMPLLLVLSLVGPPARAIDCHQLTQPYSAQGLDPYDVRHQLLRDGTTADTARYLVGDSVSVVDRSIREAVRRVDHFVASGNTEMAKEVSVEVNLLSMNPNFARVVTIEKLWSLVEYARLRIVTAERRLLYLEWLEGALPPKAAAIAELKERETEIFNEQKMIFGSYFKPYYRLRKHFEAILKNPQCRHTQCLRSVQWLLEDVGTRDAQVRSLAEMEDQDFEKRLLAAGVPAERFPEKIFALLLEATLPKDLDKNRWTAARDEDGLAEVLEGRPRLLALEAMPLAAVTAAPRFPSVNLIEGLALLEAEIDPVVQLWSQHREKSLQLTHLLRRFFQNPWFTKLSFFAISRINPRLTEVLDQSPFTKWFFAKMKGRELLDRFGYEVISFYRNSEMTIEQKIMHLHTLNDRGREAGLDVFELIARRSDLLYFWHDIYSEIHTSMAADSKAPAASGDKRILYATLGPKIEDLEKRRVADELEPISAIYPSSPIDMALKFAFLSGTTGGAGYALLQWLK